jgi:hypothetical protein
MSGQIVAALARTIWAVRLSGTPSGNTRSVRGVQWGVTVATAILLAGLASGCDKVTGGGWIGAFANPLEKASFGFSAKCRNRTVNATRVAVLYEGQLEYQDRSAGIRVHGDVEPDEFIEFSGMTCQEVHEFAMSPAAIFRGTYRSQPDGRQGEFMVTVLDSGEPGMNGDEFCIDLTGAIIHMNCGPVQGGNIQVH